MSRFGHLKRLLPQTQRLLTACTTQRLNNKLRGSRLLAAYTFCAASCFFLFGFENGVMGGLVNGAPFLGTFGLNLQRDDSLIGAIVALFDVGCVIGALGTLFFAEHIGRVRTIFLAAIISLVGGLLQGLSKSIAVLIVGRIISGVGLGALNCTAPILISEVSPPQYRGLLVCIMLTMLNCGIMISYWIDFAFRHFMSEIAWRIPVLLQLACVFAIICSLIYLPESPRWLALRGYNNESQRVIAQLQDTDINSSQVLLLHKMITENLNFETSSIGKWTEMLKGDRIHSRRRVLLACAVQFFQQIGGVNSITYYSAYIFTESVQLSPKMASLMSGILFTFYFVASFVTWFVIDRVGRRMLLLTTLPIMSAIFIVLTIVLHNPDKTKGIIAIVCIFSYYFLFTLGFQAVVWLIPSEILPLRLRTKGSGISTAVNWMFKYLIVQITPVAINRIQSRYYILFAVMNATAVPIFYIYYKETGRKKLEEIDHLYAKKIPHDDSNESEFKTSFSGFSVLEPKVSRAAHDRIQHTNKT